MDLSIDPTFDSLLDQLLENEKVDACRWLRTEMDSLVSPFVDQLFRKLKIKLTTGLKLHCEDNGRVAHLSSSSSRRNVSSLNYHNFQSTFHDLPSSSSTSFSSSSQSSSVHHQHHHYPNRSLESSPSSMNFEPQILIKEDFSDDDDDDDSSNSNNLISSRTATDSNNSIDFSKHEHEDDDEECDCEDCLNDSHLMMKGGDQDNQEPVSQEPNDHETQKAGPSQPKKFRMSLESSSNSSNSTTNPQPQQPLIQEQVEEHNPPDPQVNIKEQLITLSINCIVQDCPGVCADRNELNQHLMQVHSIQKYRCIAKDCRQSFSTQKAFGAHLRTHHPTTRVWPCALCPRTFTSYYVLHNHISHNHYTGAFQCSFPDCTFIREHRGKVISHYRIHQGYACQFPNCGQTFKAAQSMKAHQRVHLGIQPYRCRWVGCGFASAARHVALGHIRKAHLNDDTILGGVAGDPRHYLRVISELL